MSSLWLLPSLHASKNKRSVMPAAGFLIALLRIFNHTLVWRERFVSAPSEAARGCYDPTWQLFYSTVFSLRWIHLTPVVWSHVDWNRLSLAFITLVSRPFLPLYSVLVHPSSTLLSSRVLRTISPKAFVKFWPNLKEFWEIQWFDFCCCWELDRKVDCVW